MTTINPASTATGASTVSSALDKTEIASNFTMFLQLLTTQLRNQRRIRRSYRSTARTTRSTRSSALFDQRRDAR
jgi:Flagellar hook capping protein - N-terminal region